jgi:amylosucrase
VADDLETRIRRWRPDLAPCLRRLWPQLDDAATESLADRLVGIARAGHGGRPDDLLALDDRRLAEPDWFQRPDMLGYAAYADRFAGTLSDVGEHADYLADLGVTYLHLMPLLMPRPAPNDGGYAVADYRNVRPDLGDNDDLRALTTTLREHGISLCLDLVLNHVALETRTSGPTSTSSPTARPPTPTRPRCRRSSRTSRPATSRGTTTSRAGSGPRSTTTSGT